MNKTYRNFVWKFFLNLLVWISIFVLHNGCIQGVRTEVQDKTEYGFEDAYEPLIDSILNLLTLEEKIHMIHGNGMFVSGGVERLGIPELNYSDGPTGIREELERDSWTPLNLDSDSVTFFPTGTALAATWNTNLAHRYGEAIGNEANARGKDVLLGPGVNMIRTPLCGRNFEYFSEDPLLASEIAVEYVRGVQTQDVAACVKHYALNNQEYQRWMINVEVHERALREIYLPVYKSTALEAEAYTFMGSYNKFRGDYVCENDYLLNKILKEEWGYKGAVISDWGATHSAIKAAKNGLDVEMGGRLNIHFFAALADSVNEGLLNEQIIDDKVRRILRVMYNCKTMDSTRVQGEANSAENIKAAYDVASESIVLLKNDKSLLPLSMEKINSIAVIGENAVNKHATGGFTAGVKARHEVSPLEGLQMKAGDKITLNYAQGYKEDFVVVDTGGRWPYRYPNSKPNQSLLKEAVKIAGTSDVAIIFAGNTRNVETEVVDRETLTLPFGQDELIKAVSKVNPNTIVVVVAGAACDVNLADSVSSTILYSWFNGSEAGNALADVLFGDVNPSGKLPFTIPVKLEDVGAHALGAYPGKNFEVNYTEGILVGYRWFDTKNIEPKYCFGHGLSYSDFEYSGLKSGRTNYAVDKSINLSLTIQNTGDYSGKEVVQIYVKPLESSIIRSDKELEAFAKLELKAGEKQTLRFQIDVNDLAFYHAGKRQWIVEPGPYKIMAGSSSRDIREETVINIK